ncbi:hypothetical protein ACIRVK_40735 [Streptomyces sp. NPDC101152]|uniref:hypothetical protein n=1 Tax=Streptomyces sp. NPDC101152 TaxID=3366116 RepID=UPI003814D7B6
MSVDWIGGASLCGSAAGFGATRAFGGLGEFGQKFLDPGDDGGVPLDLARPSAFCGRRND